MTNNEILKRIRYIFDYDDVKMIEIFAMADHKVHRKQISDWFKNDDHESYVELSDTELALFLNGLIIEKRGRKEDADGNPQSAPQPESELNNNIIFNKIKIALNLKSDDVLDVMQLADFYMSKHELTAFFRRPDHKHYQPCKNQILRNFLKGVQLKYRP